MSNSNGLMFLCLACAAFAQTPKPTAPELFFKESFQRTIPIRLR